MALSIRHFLCILTCSSPGIVEIVVVIMSRKGEKERKRWRCEYLFGYHNYAIDLSLIVLFLCPACIASNKWLPYLVKITLTEDNILIFSVIMYFIQPKLVYQDTYSTIKVNTI